MNVTRNKTAIFWYPDDGTGPHSMLGRLGVHKICDSGDGTGYVILVIRVDGMSEFIAEPNGWLDVRSNDCGPLDHPYTGDKFCEINLSGSWDEMWIHDLATFDFDGSEVDVFVKVPCLITWSFLAKKQENDRGQV
jgi:hypothetical protein